MSKIPRGSDGANGASTKPLFPVRSTSDGTSLTGPDSHVHSWA